MFGFKNEKKKHTSNLYGDKYFGRCNIKTKIKTVNNLKGRMREKETRKEKREKEKGRKEGNSSKKRENILIMFPCCNIGLPF